MKAKAVITTKWDKKTYRPFTVDQVESYYIDTAIDSDSDQFQLVIGDPEHTMIEALKRDNEIRVQIFGVGYGAKKLFTGFGDDALYDEQGKFTINGRDMSCLAVDSTVPPKLWKSIKASDLISKQAREVGMKGPFHITTKGTVKKLQFTDASESYWDFWYRLVRKDKMYIWTDPEGGLWVGFLNYDQQPLYGFGTPPSNASVAERKARWSDVQSLEFRKSTQGRIGEVWVFGHKGDRGLSPAVRRDEDMQGWIRRPRKIMMDTEGSSTTQLNKLADEEIYESKVGSVELRLTITDPGYVIDQNRMAFVNIPAMGLKGSYFVVGTRIQGSESGFVQEVRLREKGFAVTRRVPADPKPADDPKDKVAGALGTALGIKYGDFFVKAAKEWHGGWNFSLFLACLIGICHQESSFHNRRQRGGPGEDVDEWYPPPTDPRSQHGHDPTAPPETLSHWQEKFANEPGQYVSRQYGVGPMQLTDQDLKWRADDLFKTGHRNQYTGGRWHVEHNIMAAAHHFRTKLQTVTRDSFRDIDIWLGVKAYNGAGPAADAYAASVKNLVLVEPGYLQQVKDAIKAAAEAAKSPTQPTPSPADPNDPDFGPLGKGFPYSSRIGQRPGEGTHSFTTPPNNWQSDNAIDISCAFGTPVYAVTSGYVGNWGVLPGSGHQIPQGPNPGSTSGDVMAGNRININGANQSCYYAHLSRLDPLVTTYGLYVKAGTRLGWSGHANGALHLHFGVEHGSPFHYIPGGDPRN